MEKEAKIIIPFHPKVSQEQIKEAKKRCQAFRTISEAEGRSIEALEVTWSLNSLSGSQPPYGILVTWKNQPRTSQSVKISKKVQFLEVGLFASKEKINIFYFVFE